MPLKSGKPSRAEVIAKLQSDLEKLQDQVESLIPIPDTKQIDAMQVHLDALENEAKDNAVFRIGAIAVAIILAIIVLIA